MSTGTAPSLTSLRIVVAAMAMGLVVLGGVALMVLDAQLPEGTWVWIALLVVTLVCGGLAATTGFRAPAIDPRAPQDEVDRRSRAALTTTTFLRVALAEAPGILAFALGFVSASSIVVVVGIALALLLLLGIAWPGRLALEKVQSSLDSAGANSRLTSMLG